ncbi:hypothetical protein ACH5RR_028642 [Cinchona calisaya]|uniref:RING-type E3 ubiquitin transferase n=1 Tax=Cinchona calisaya TaxID=153742 RepID=A0ABD2YPD5_9GENT
MATPSSSKATNFTFFNMGSDDQERYGPSAWHRKSKYDLNSKIMLTAIVSLSVVVVLVTILHIYVRFLLRRQARRRATLRHLGIIASAQIHSNEPPKRGLDPSVIASLPVFVFNHGENVETSSLECSVCLSVLEEGEMARKLPNCNHIFHAECIDKWFGSQSTCPICRSEAEPRLQLVLQPEPREAPTAPPLECVNLSGGLEGTSSGGNGIQFSAKINGSSPSSRLSSFRRILSRERSSPRIQHSGQEDCCEDLERQ